VSEFPALTIEPEQHNPQRGMKKRARRLFRGNLQPAGLEAGEASALAIYHTGVPRAKLPETKSALLEAKWPPEKPVRPVRCRNPVAFVLNSLLGALQKRQCLIKHRFPGAALQN
jgi:hypothetical protein